MKRPEPTSETPVSPPTATHLRPTHRARIWSAPGAEPTTLELVIVPLVVDDVTRGFEARTLQGGLIATLGADGAWYWADGPAPARFEIVGISGRRPRAEGAATHQIPIRFPAAGRRRAGYVAMRVSADELSSLRRAAGETPLPDWIRALPGVAPRLGAAKIRAIALLAAGMTER